MKTKASAPGKLVVLGEYALLEGAPALVAAVDRHVKVEMSTGNQSNGISVDIKHLNTGPMPLHAGTLSFNGVRAPGAPAKQVRALLAVLKTTGVLSQATSADGRSVDLTIDAGPFFSVEGIKLGFGSSAAITVAISGLAAFLQQNSAVDPIELIEKSIRIHRSLQSEMGSGIDVAASAMGGFLKFQSENSHANSLPKISLLKPLSGVYIDAVWSGQSASTAAFLSGMAGFKAGRPNAYRLIMQGLAEACQKGTAAYAQKRPNQFLAAIDDYTRGLSELSFQSGLPIFSPVHQELGRIARAHGGLYKPSGAGGGDVGLAFTSCPRKRDQIRAAFSRAGFQVFDLRWGVEGFRLNERKNR